MVGGVTKKQATANAEYYANEFPEDIAEKGRHGRAPIYTFVKEKYWKQRATKTSMQPYGAFTLWIFGNPTVFQKRDYQKQGYIDNFQNTLERRHEDNYLHTDICNQNPRTMELDNGYYFPDVEKIAEDVSTEFIGYGPTGYEYPHMFGNPTIQSIEINQDILVHPYDSVSVQQDLVSFFLSTAGSDYLQRTGYRRLTLFESGEHPGYSMELNYGKEGNIKIYPKTQHGIRVEAALFGNKHIRKHFNRKSYTDLDRVKNEIAKPLIRKVDVPRLLQEQPPPRDITPYLFEKFIHDPVERNMAKKLYDRRYLLKQEIAPQYLRGKTRILEGTNHEGIWHYVLKDFCEEG